MIARPITTSPFTNRNRPQPTRRTVALSLVGWSSTAQRRSSWYGGCSRPHWITHDGATVVKALFGPSGSGLVIGLLIGLSACTVAPTPTAPTVAAVATAASPAAATAVAVASPLATSVAVASPAA